MGNPNASTPFQQRKISPRALPYGWRRVAISSRHRHSWVEFLQHQPMAIVALLLAVGSWGMGGHLSQYSFWLKTSLTGVPNVEWQGAMYPLLQVSDRTQMTYADRSVHFDALPENKKMALPRYDLGSFKRGMSPSANSADRQAYLVWSVPHSGNYELDGSEWTGSHPGVDMVTNEGTPVVSMAAGVVTDMGEQPYGFGKYIVVTHPNVPMLNDSSQTTTLRSMYGHLSEYSVQMGEVVNKGQKIGKVGSTGTSTTPHLHWQVENINAPYSPYWPFNSADMAAAGISSYFDAVKYGVGQDNVRQYTVHPAEYVAQYSSSAVASAGVSDTRPGSYQPTPQPIAEDNPSVNGIEFYDTGAYFRGERNQYKLWIPLGTNRAGGVTLSASDPRVSLTPSLLSQVHFDGDGMATFTASGDIDSPFIITARGAFGMRQTDEIVPQWSEQNQPPLNVIVPEIEIVVPTPEPEPEKAPETTNGQFSDVGESHPYRDAIEYWADAGVLRGYPSGEFRPDWDINRAEALKVILLALDVPLDTPGDTFPDVASDAWFAGPVSTAVNRNIVGGYPDGYFRPGWTVTRAEFVKMTLEAAQIYAPEVAFAIAEDVPAEAWFSRYMAYAKTANLLPDHLTTNLNPGEKLTRGEASYILHKAKN